MSLNVAFIVVGAIGSGVMACAFFVAYFSLRGRPQPIERSPKEMGLAYDSVSFASLDGTSLRGWFVPSQSSPQSHTTVILCHGFRSDRSSFLEIAPALSQAGYHLLLFDFRVCGESGGRFGSLGCLEALDVRAAVEFLKSVKPQAAYHINVVGASLGAVAGLIAAGHDRRIERVVAISAFANVTEIIQRYLWISCRLPRWLASLTIRCGRQLLGVHATQVAPLMAVRRLRSRPVFFIHGEQDPLVPLDHVLRLHQTSRGQKSLWIIPEAGHCLERLNAPIQDYVKEVVAFLKTSDGLLNG